VLLKAPVSRGTRNAAYAASCARCRNRKSSIKILEQAEKGEQTVAAVCREHGIAENTFYRWRKAYGGMSLNEVQRLKDLEKENARLKRLLAERDLEVDALKELLAKKL
jgi:putative transposase